MNGHMHNSRGSGWTKLYPAKQRFWDANRKDKPIIHSSVLLRTNNVSNDSSPVYKPWILKLDHEVEQ